MTKQDRPLRRGWTTGTCAAAAAKAAFGALVTGEFVDPVEVTLPRGQTPAFALALARTQPGSATAGVVKDAGDDPDVTHGALILATARAGAPGSGVTFRAGEGVGTVTRPGLAIAPGEPAINPVPRQMIRDAVAQVAARVGCAADAEIEIAIPGGEALAQKTLNPRLGIVGGLSILGTTGIVVPYSCSAWIHSIYRGVDVARAAGLDPYRGLDRLDLGSLRAETLWPSGDRADRYGRLRGRHAQVYSHASSAAGHHRGRRRQDQQARAGPARSAFETRHRGSSGARRCRASGRRLERSHQPDSCRKHRRRGVCAGRRARHCARRSGARSLPAPPPRAWSKVRASRSRS